MRYLGNAFSIQMLPVTGSLVSVEPVEPDVVASELSSGFTSCIGHLDTANVVSSLLGLEVQMNRINVSLKPEDTMFVAQITGGRLPEGSTTLPEGVKILFFKVRLV